MPLLETAANAVTVFEFFRRLGIAFKGSPERNRRKPYYRLGQWPEIGRGVVGRDELTELVADQLGNRRVVAIVRGQGGIGKTTLARHYVERHAERYHGIIWVQAENEATLVADLTLLAAAADVTGLEHMAPKQRARALLDTLERRDEDWLVVFDNAPDEKALTGWAVKGDRVRMLVTSRYTAWSQRYRQFSPDVLSTETAGDAGPVLLMNEAVRQDDPDVALDLARDLGGLPLALVAAGGLIRERGGSFAEYREKLAAVLTQVPAGDYPESVVGAVKLSYDKLDEDAKAVLDLFAWYAPDGLEARLLTDVAMSERSPEVLEGIDGDLSSLCADAGRVEAAIAVLRRRSLLTWQGVGYGLHRTTAASVNALQEQAGQRGEAARAAAAVLAASYPGGRRQPAHPVNWPDCARLTPHVLALHRAWPLGAEGTLTSAAADYLFNQASIYLLQMAEFEPAVALAEAALTQKRAQLPESHRNVAVAWSILGLAYESAGRLAAAVKAQAENVRLCQIYNHGLEDLATAHNNHAGALRILGRKKGDRALLDQALKADEAALALERQLCGGEECEGVARSLNNLAQSHDALGDTAAARNLSLQALKVDRKVLPPGDVRLGPTLTSAGSFQLKLGQTAAALPLLAEALNLFSTAYRRDDHPEVRIAATWLVECHLVLARRDPAQAAVARRIANQYGLDWAERQRMAARYPGPVDAAG